ncbi:MAG: single-stranded DNA-binding protein [Proteobacteria bacterium]|nr:single-stranded DNA-binding protein [Pseudomonadota bacterium]MCH9758180.1 single-stranded DNA-binding protein [Pseudomonadota bacterium]
MSAVLINATKQLAKCCRQSQFSAPVSHVYYPLEYAWAAHEQYLQRFATGRKKAIFVGMNPGPWGMGQTGIPFGDVVSVRDWLGICTAVKTPEVEHPKRIIQGFDCPRREVSGTRLWGLFAECYGSAEQFFSQHFVINYCPLLFLGATAANVTPDKLPAATTAALYRCCDTFLKKAVAELQPHYLIGVGGFAEKRLQLLFNERKNYTISKILHPSPASPAANRSFTATASGQLAALGLL